MVLVAGNRAHFFLSSLFEDHVQGLKWGADYLGGSSYDPIQAGFVLLGQGTVPRGDGKCQYALYGRSVKMGESVFAHTEFL